MIGDIVPTTHTAVAASGLDWGSITKTIAAWTGPPALVLTLFNTWAKRSENRQLHQQNAEIENIRSNLRRFESRNKTQFDWLHKRRARAAVELYGLIIDLDRTVFQLLAHLRDSPIDPEAKAKLFSAATKAGDAFRERYPKLGLLLSEELLDELRNSDDMHWQKFVIASVFGKDQTPDDRLTLYKASDWGTFTAAVTRLRASLRKALGDVVDEVRHF